MKFFFSPQTAHKHKRKDLQLRRLVFISATIRQNRLTVTQNTKRKRSQLRSTYCRTIVATPKAKKTGTARNFRVFPIATESSAHSFYCSPPIAALPFSHPASPPRFQKKLYGRWNRYSNHLGAAISRRVWFTTTLRLLPAHCVSPAVHLGLFFPHWREHVFASGHCEPPRCWLAVLPVYSIHLFSRRKANLQKYRLQFRKYNSQRSTFGCDRACVCFVGPIK